MQTIRVPLGDGTASVPVPAGWRASVAERRANGSPPFALPRKPDPQLAALVQGKRKVVIAFTDATRACPDDVLIPHLLDQLQGAGVPDEAITLLCAVGMHRPMSDDEIAAKLGADVAARYRAISHDPATAVSLGDFNDVPLTMNPLCLEADLLLATGVVEPHHYAGWSGGGKTVAIGCTGADTIASTHSPRLLDDPGVRLGRVQGNPFQDIVHESARRTGLDYVLNVGLDEEGGIVAMQSGPAEEVHAALVAEMAARSSVEADAPFDVIIAGVGHPKDVNLYQASRAATYVGLSQHTLLKQGGAIIVPATCPEGAGQGVGERNFFDGISSAPDIEGLLDRLRREGCRPGEQRAYMVGLVLREHPIIVAGSRDPDVVRACHMTPAADLEEALDIAANLPGVGDAPDLLVVPHATQTLPVPRSTS